MLSVPNKRKRKVKNVFSVDVTKEDLEKGLPCNKNRCALAVVLLNKFNIKSVSVYCGHAEIDGKQYKHDGGDLVSEFDKSRWPIPQTVRFELIKDNK